MVGSLRNHDRYKRKQINLRLYLNFVYLNVRYHHLQELFAVNSAGSVRVDFGDHSIEVLGCQFIVKSAQDLAKNFCRDVTVAFGTNLAQHHSVIRCEGTSSRRSYLPCHRVGKPL